MDFVTVEVKDKIKELIKLLTRSDEVSDNVMERAVRMLRQANDGHVEHTVAIKQRIRQAILSNTVSGTNGPALVSAFEKHCDNLRKINSSLLSPFLSLLEPLSYSLVPHNQFGSRINTVKESDAATFRVADNLSSSNSNLKETPSSSSSSSCSSSSSSTAQQGVKSSLPAISYAIAGGLMPIVPPYHTSGVDVNSVEAQMAWISTSVEIKLLKDLIFVFQVKQETCILMKTLYLMCQCYNYAVLYCTVMCLSDLNVFCYLMRKLLMYSLLNANI